MANDSISLEVQAVADLLHNTDMQCSQSSGGNDVVAVMREWQSVSQVGSAAVSSSDGGAPVIDPLELLRGIISCGFAHDAAARVAEAYYKALVPPEVPAVKVTSRKSSASSVLRNERWRSEMAALAELSGCCYLRVVRWGRRKFFHKTLGEAPLLRTFVSMLEPGDVDVDAARTVNLYRVGVGCGEATLFHIAADCREGTCLGTAYDCISSVIQLYPFVNDKCHLDPPSVNCVVPLVGRVGVITPELVALDTCGKLMNAVDHNRDDVQWVVLAARSSKQPAVLFTMSSEHVLQSGPQTWGTVTDDTAVLLPKNVTLSHAGFVYGGVGKRVLVHLSGPVDVELLALGGQPFLPSVPVDVMVAMSTDSSVISWARYGKYARVAGAYAFTPTVKARASVGAALVSGPVGTHTEYSGVNVTYSEVSAEMQSEQLISGMRAVVTVPSRPQVPLMPDVSAMVCTSYRVPDALTVLLKVTVEGVGYVCVADVWHLVSSEPTLFVLTSAQSLVVWTTASAMKPCVVADIVDPTYLHWWFVRLVGLNYAYSSASGEHVMQEYKRELTECEKLAKTQISLLLSKMSETDQGCALHTRPLTSQSRFAPTGCARSMSGIAPVIQSAVAGTEVSCDVDKRTKAMDLQFLRVVESDYDPAVLCGRERPPELIAFRDSGSNKSSMRNFGNGYCYLSLVSAEYRWRIARLLGPNPYLILLVKILPWVGRSRYKPVVLTQVMSGFYHVSEVREKISYENAGINVYKQLCDIASIEPSARIGTTVNATSSEVLDRINTLATPALAILLSCASMLVAIVILMIRITFMRGWYVR